MDNPIPFDEIENKIVGGYFWFWKEYKPKTAHYLRLARSHGIAHPTLADICAAIESQDKQILAGYNNGVKTVRYHIEIFYEHGIVDKDWRDTQLARYQHK